MSFDVSVALPYHEMQSDVLACHSIALDVVLYPQRSSNMKTLFSQPKIPLLASSLPRTQPWRVHVICLCQIGGFTVTSAFLFLLGLNLAEIPGNYLLLPHAVVNLAVPIINTFVAASGLHALSVYRWGRSALQQTTMPDAEPVPVSPRVTRYLWWLILFRITTREDRSAQQRAQEEAPELTALPQGVQAEVSVQGVAVLLEEIRISFFQACAIIMQGAAKSVEVGNMLLERRVALLARLCLYRQDTRRHILLAIYGGDTDEAKDAFYHDVPRLLDTFTKLARRFHFLPLPVEALLEPRGNLVWRISSLVVADQKLMRFLQRWKRRVDEAVSCGRSWDRMRLRRLCAYMITTYGDGFLATPLLCNPLHWSWAKHEFFAYRRCYIALLKYAAQLELGASAQPGEQREECLRYAALYYECAMLAKLKVESDPKESMEYRDQCLTLYRLLSDVSAIERVQAMFDQLSKQKHKKKEQEDERSGCIGRRSR